MFQNIEDNRQSAQNEKKRWSKILKVQCLN